MWLVRPSPTDFPPESCSLHDGKKEADGTREQLQRRLFPSGQPKGEERGSRASRILSPIPSPSPAAVCVRGRCFARRQGTLIGGDDLATMREQCRSLEEAISFRREAQLGLVTSLQRLVPDLVPSLNRSLRLIAAFNGRPFVTTPIPNACHAQNHSNLKPHGKGDSCHSKDLVRFVRLNGILFTRTSLEMFGELSATVISDFQILLSCGPDEELNFGLDATENAISLVKLIAILIFTVHNVKKDSNSQSYAEIVQRRVLLQNAFATAFEFVGYLLKRCLELHDVASSIYLPAILVFIEWLACHPDFVASSEMKEKQADARSFFWNQCVSFVNKLILTGLARADGDDDVTCFFDMGMRFGNEITFRMYLVMK